MITEFVVDASVIFKWLNQTNEEDIDQAIELLHQAKLENIYLFTSDLAVHEVMNALIRGKGVRGEMLKEAINRFWQLPLHVLVTDDMVTETAAIVAVEQGITFYDSVYLALAFGQAMPLVTANTKHHKKLPDTEVIALAEWRLTQ